MDYTMTQYVTGLIGKAVEKVPGSTTSSPAFNIGGGGSSGVSINLVSQLNTGMSKGG